MLELRPNCEHCDRDLPPNAIDAMICTFECTFCVNCVDTVLHNVCPNCGGGLVRRPIRPHRLLAKYPPSQQRVFKPVKLEEHQARLEQLRDIPPAER